MKPWQKGYELDTLIDWTNKFESFNKHCHSPFMQAKKNGMAELLYVQPDLHYLEKLL